MTKIWTGSQIVLNAKGQVEQQSMKMMAQNEEGDFLLKINNLSDIPNRNLARQNLGITASLVMPTDPKVNDLWIDLNS